MKLGLRADILEAEALVRKKQKPRGFGPGVCRLSVCRGDQNR